MSKASERREAQNQGRPVTALTPAELEAVFGEAVAEAKAEAFAAGVPITGEVGGRIVTIHPDGRVEPVEEIVRDGKAGARGAA